MVKWVIEEYLIRGQGGGVCRVDIICVKCWVELTVTSKSKVQRKEWDKEIDKEREREREGEWERKRKSKGMEERRNYREIGKQTNRQT